MKQYLVFLFIVPPPSLSPFPPPPSPPPIHTHTHTLTDQVQKKLEANNVFVIARRSVDISGLNQELLYMSLKYVNNIWVLAELKITSGATTISVSWLTSLLPLISQNSL